MLLVGLFLGGGIGFVLAAGSGVTLDGHDHDTNSHSAETAAQHAAGETATRHYHDGLVWLQEGKDAPILNISLTQDPVSGWNLQIKTSNFRFAPENASRKHVPGEGHAHVYLDGVKIARQYGPWLHIPGLAEGEHEVEVTLNANDHRLLAVGDKPLRAAAKIRVE